ncbi:hypothetical protein GQ54DRAFT_335702 [Martensiomyces pterosporus]|nr:hypothetical protein GQ54DRAFT_335702 [Martensiomyces pterosporus]
MSKPSPRDLLRRAREQKKKQQQNAKRQHEASTDSQRASGGQISAIANDPLARLDSLGSLRCELCQVGVKPADVSGWNAHKSSRRHTSQLQSKHEPASSATKRPHGEDTQDSHLEISDSDGAKNSEAEAEAKRQKVDAADSPHLALFSYGSDSDNNTSDDDGDDKGKNATQNTDKVEDESSNMDDQLPAGFFDEGIQPDDDDGDDDDNAHSHNDNEETNKGEQNGHAAADSGAEPRVNLPQGFFDSTDEQAAVSLGLTVAQVEADKEKTLARELANFESEIADLAQEGAEVRTEDEVNLHRSLEEDLEQQDGLWKARTARLTKMRRIIKDGVEEMDPNEKPDASNTAGPDSSSDEESDAEDYAEFLDWRSSKV